jgi:transglutaminase-like putative cysteine protease
MKLTGDTSDPKEIYRRIEQDFGEHFVYTLDPPHADGDPVIHFLLRSKTGHCEYFASATVLMLTARGIPARLVTGSYGGEVGFFSRSFVVRGSNLHAWVEADLEGTGFAVLDSTPDAGVPPATRRVSWLTRLTSLGREMEFFYDRRILGFDSLDQAMAAETARHALETAASAASSWKRVFRDGPSAAGGWALAAVALVAVILLLAGRWRRRPRVSEATRAYLALRRLLGRRLGFLSPATAPADVARLVAEAAPEGREDAEAVVRIYCADAFGGIEPDARTVRELDERVRRLKKLA